MQIKSCFYYAIISCALLSTIQNHGSIQQLVLIPATGGTISAPGTYVLGYDITGNINIESNQVVLDLNGHTITGGTINIPNTTSRNNIIIRNGTVQNSTANGITSTGPSNVNPHTNITLSNLIIDDPVSVGISIENCNGLLISNVLIGKATTGISLDDVDIATIKNATVYSCTNGIATALTGSDQVSISNCLVYDCSGNGFNVGNLCQVIGCTATNNGVGFLCQDGPGVIANCSALKNTTDGIQITTGSWEVLNCQANQNGATGIYAAAAPNIIMKLCQAAYNTGDGFKLSEGTNGSVEGCSAISNGGIGFDDLAATSDVNYSSNLAVNNAGDNSFGIVINPFVTYTDSTAYWHNIMQPADV